MRACWTRYIDVRSSIVIAITHTVTRIIYNIISRSVFIPSHYPFSGADFVFYVLGEKRWRLPPTPKLSVESPMTTRKKF